MSTTASVVRPDRWSCRLHDRRESITIIWAMHPLISGRIAIENLPHNTFESVRRNGRSLTCFVLEAAHERTHCYRARNQGSGCQSRSVSHTESDEAAG